MKFILKESFDKSIPGWLKEIFLYDFIPMPSIKRKLPQLDLHNAKFEDLSLPYSEDARRLFLISLVTAVYDDKSNPPDRLLFLLIRTASYGKETDLLWCPKYGDDFVADDGKLSYILLQYPERVLEAGYLYDWQKDEKKEKDRIKNRLDYNNAILNSQERYDYDRSLYSKNHIMLNGRSFDASGYLIKPDDYYLKKLLSYQKRNEAKTLVSIYDKLVDISNKIKKYISNEANLLDHGSVESVRSLLNSLSFANIKYDSVMKKLHDCKNQEEVDELFEKGSDLYRLNKIVKELNEELREIEYTDIEW